MSFQELTQFAARVGRRAKKDLIGSRAAALAFYMIFALVPLLVLVLSIFSLLMGQRQVQQMIISFFSSRIGTQGSTFFHNILHQVSTFEVNTFASVIGIVLVLYAATNLFLHLQKTFAAIFSVKETEEGIIQETVKKRTLAFSFMVIFFALIFLLIVVNIASSVLFGAIQSLWANIIPSLVFQLGKYMVTFLLSIFIFGFMYHFASAGKISWKSAFFGGLVAAFLFGVINALLSVYLSFSNHLSAYGAAGFLIAFLLWFYYVSMALFLGGEVSAVFHYTEHLYRSER
ncbi:MAG TPA: YihY/virulence factor BrkB family protein [Candidatus Paceibacterota bacterium]|nr:YihY/virulence factor BrkB family protein [Candidatus Paceibacterota bacterium]